MKPLLYALLCLSLWVQAILPAGFMPNFEDGRFSITICAGLESLIIDVDADGNPISGPLSGPASDEDARQNTLCPYAVGSQSVMSPGPVVMLDVIVYEALAYSSPQHHALQVQKFVSFFGRAPPVRV